MKYLHPVSCFLSVPRLLFRSPGINIRGTKMKSEDKYQNQHRYTHLAQLNLVPLSEAWDAHYDSQLHSSPSFASLLPKLECGCFDSEGTLLSSSADRTPYRLYLATDFDDLPPIAQLTIDVFDVSAIALSSSSDWNALEQAIIGSVVQPAIGVYNSWAQAVGYTEVLSGLRKRIRNRMSEKNNGNEHINETDSDLLAPLAMPDSHDLSGETDKITFEKVAARSSLILALARPSTGDDIEVVASIELRLQPTDAKIPFSQPWLDKLERRIVSWIPFVQVASTPTSIESKVSSSCNDREDSPEIVSIDNRRGSYSCSPLRPYLCNLCVSPSLRSMGIGRSLCRIVEAIARDIWEFSHIYLHVDPANDAARSLYEKEGYVDVGKRWNVIWAGGANEISYYVKRIT